MIVMTTEIRTTRNTINWPKNANIPDYAILNIVQAKVIQDSQPLPEINIDINRDNLNYNDPKPNQSVTLIANLNNQTLTKKITVDYVDPKYADYQPSSQPASPHDHYTPATSKTNKKSHKGYIMTIIVVILTILALYLGLNSRHQKQVNNNQNNRIAKLQNENNKQARQIQELKDAQQQYKQDGDQAKLQQSLNNIESQLSNNSNDQAIQHAIDQIKQNPQQGQQYIDDLTNSSSTAQNIENQIKNWLAQFGIILNN